jgi:PKHD-type hydroxylase
MILCIAHVLTLEELSLIRAKLETAEFVDGKETAGWHARLVKHNTQLRSDSSVAAELRDLLQQALRRSRLLQMAARPKIFGPILFSRYETGMAYGSHVDNPLMGTINPIRSDLSWTVFLQDPTSYRGGELVIESPQGEQGFKLEAGAMILYPSTTLHRVEAVTAGVRLVAVGWIQSFVRDANAREILFDLDTARQKVFDQSGKTPEFDLISKSHANLLRMWGDL